MCLSDCSCRCRGGIFHMWPRLNVFKEIGYRQHACFVIQVEARTSILSSRWLFWLHQEVRIPLWSLHIFILGKPSTCPSVSFQTSDMYSMFCAMALKTVTATALKCTYFSSLVFFFVSFFNEGEYIYTDVKPAFHLWLFQQFYLLRGTLA